MNVDRYLDAEQALYSAWGLEATERRIRLAGIGSEVRVVECGDGEPLLFVHGTNNNGASFAPMLPGLVDGYRCIALDRPGCGLSDPLPTPVTTLDGFEQLGDRLIGEVVDGLDVGPLRIVSTSLGGYYTLRSVAARPECATAVFQIGYTVGAPTNPLPLFMRMGALPGMAKLTLKMPVTKFAVKSILNQLGLGDGLRRGRNSDEFISWFQAMARDTDTMVNEVSIGQVLSTFKGFNPNMYLSDALLQSISVPTSFLWGGQDIFGGSDVAREFVARVPGAELEIMEGAGHAPFVDDPDHVAQAARTFFAAH